MSDILRKLRTQQMLRDSVDGPLTLDEYQTFALQTDTTKPFAPGPKGIPFLALGLFGEVGSLLSELKKQRRDQEPHKLYVQNQIEEFGDVLWYFAVIADRASWTLRDIAHAAGANADSALPMYQGISQPTTFSDIQKSEAAAVDEGIFLASLLDLGYQAGQIVGDSNKLSSGPHEMELLHSSLQSFFRHLLATATNAGLSLGTIALLNLEKTESRWPANQVHSERFDKAADVNEQLPDEIRMEFRQKQLGNKKYVYQRWNGVNIGDRLTDNATQEDDFRFHDVFHLAHYAILGWSPVLRALLRLKRKSNSLKDEVEDGARAILIEEGVATWVFNYAKHLKFFEESDRLEYGLLKAIQRLTLGCEVNACGLWEWEKAILSGYKVFRLLKEHEGGLIIASLANRSITYERLR